ncbi:MAG: AI-2E family transporter [Acidimicrobiales bacterium]
METSDARHAGTVGGDEDGDPASPSGVASRTTPTVGRSGRSVHWQVPRWLDILSGWLWRLGLVGLALVVFVRLFAYLRLVTAPILFALVLTAILWPPRRVLTRRGLPALAATWLVMAVAIGVVAGVIWVASAGVSSQLATSLDWEETRDELDRWLVEGPLDLDAALVDDLESRAIETLRSGAISASTSQAGLVLEIASAILLTIVLLFFFIKDGPQIWSFLVRQARSDRGHVLDRAGRAAFGALEGYAWGVAITGAVDAVAVGIVLVILDVPLALPLALLTFFAAFIPIVGAASVGVLSTLVALVTVGPRAAIILAIATVVIQQVEGNVILPLVMRRRVNLHPVVILLALAAGGVTAGLLGALVAVPVTAMAAAALRRVGSITTADDAVEGPGDELVDDGGREPHRDGPAPTAGRREVDDRLPPPRPG